MANFIEPEPGVLINLDTVDEIDLIDTDPDSRELPAVRFWRHYRRKRKDGTIDHSSVMTYEYEGRDAATLYERLARNDRHEQNRERIGTILRSVVDRRTGTGPVTTGAPHVPPKPEPDPENPPSRYRDLDFLIGRIQKEAQILRANAWGNPQSLAVIMKSSASELSKLAGRIAYANATRPTEA